MRSGGVGHPFALKLSLSPLEFCHWPRALSRKIRGTQRLLIGLCIAAVQLLQHGRGGIGIRAQAVGLAKFPHSGGGTGAKAAVGAVGKIAQVYQLALHPAHVLALVALEKRLVGCLRRDPGGFGLSGGRRCRRGVAGGLVDRGLVGQFAQVQRNLLHIDIFAGPVIAQHQLHRQLLAFQHGLLDPVGIVLGIEQYIRLGIRAGIRARPDVIDAPRGQRDTVDGHILRPQRHFILGAVDDPQIEPKGQLAA